MSKSIDEAVKEVLNKYKYCEYNSKNMEIVVDPEFANIVSSIKDLFKSYGIETNCFDNKIKIIK